MGGCWIVVSHQALEHHFLTPPSSEIRLEMVTNQRCQWFSPVTTTKIFRRMGLANTIVIFLISTSLWKLFLIFFVWAIVVHLLVPYYPQTFERRHWRKWVRLGPPFWKRDLCGIRWPLQKLPSPGYWVFDLCDFVQARPRHWLRVRKL